MITVKGIYENGQVKLLEIPPVENTYEVLVTFMEENEESEKLRQITMSQSSKDFKEYLEDEREDLYQEYVKGV